MIEAINKIVAFVTEEDDSDWKDVVHSNHWTEGDSWTEHTLKPLGFKYREMGCRGWEKSVGSRMASVGASTTQGKGLLVLYRRTSTGRWQQETSVTAEYGDEVLAQLRTWGIIR